MSIPGARSLLFLGLSVTATGAARASPPPSYGIDFVTVGAAGNRPTLPSEVPYNPELQVGAVDHEYRIGRTEVTNTQWLEFVNAYKPYWTGRPDAIAFTGAAIWPSPQGYYIEAGAEQAPVAVMWRMAARYCNWLQNEKRPEQWAFETGAYDTSTFSLGEFGSADEQATRSPGAKFWLPSRDEWIKAAFYDPNRYGPDQEGYWQGPNRSDDILISGLPSRGGQTSAGPDFPSAPWYFPVGSYEDVYSPWGLQDVSGGQREWAEDLVGTGRPAMGSLIRGGAWIGQDRPENDGFILSPGGPWAGFRVASQVPTPGTIPFLVVFVVLKRSR